MSRNRSQEIHDMIQQFSMAGHPELMVSRVLDILTAINERMDEIERACSYDKNTDEHANRD